MKFSITTATLLAGGAVATANAAYSCDPVGGARFGISRRGCAVPQRGFLSAGPFSSILSDVFDTMPRRRRYRRPSILDQAFEVLGREMRELGREVDNAVKEKLNTIYPEYQVNSDDELFSVSIDLPGVDSSNIDVLVEDDLLTIEGFRETNNSKYQFRQTFRFDPSVILVDKLEANMENGVLTVTAPKDVKKNEEKIKKIPINFTKGDEGELVSQTTTTLQAETAVEENESERESKSDEVLDVNEKDLDEKKTSI